MKEPTSKYRGLAKRALRKERHKNRAEVESRLFELQRREMLEFSTRGVNNDFTPTDYFVVEFNLSEKMSLAKFRNIMNLIVCEMLWENLEPKD